MTAKTENYVFFFFNLLTNLLIFVLYYTTDRTPKI